MTTTCRILAMGALLSLAAPAPAHAATALDGLLFRPGCWDREASSLPSPPFQPLDRSGTALRCPPGGVTLLGRRLGEGLAQIEDGKLASLTFSLHNQIDDGPLTKTAWQERLAEWRGRIERQLRRPPKNQSSRDTVSVTRLTWRHVDTSWILEGGESLDGAQDAWIRLRLVRAERHAPVQANKPVPRHQLRSRVTRRRNGDVLIENLPMIDQGPRGYCAVASAERVLRHYGMAVDQHQLAQIALTSATEGTAVPVMEAALAAVAGRLQVDIERHHAIDIKHHEQRLRAYNLAARRKGKKTFPVEPTRGLVQPVAFLTEAEPGILRETFSREPDFQRFQASLRNHIDQGIPLLWSVQLGVVAEKGLPQAEGGHMRLIIGYNGRVGTVIYSDSWGRGHAEKTLPAIDAYIITHLTHTLTPSR